MQMNANNFAIYQGGSNEHSTVDVVMLLMVVGFCSYQCTANRAFHWQPETGNVKIASKGGVV